MFGKEKTREVQTPITSKSTSKDIKTLIGEGCKVEGNFYIPTYTRVDGTVKGDLTGESGIIVGNQGKVEGNICSPEVVVYGTVSGNIECQRVELKKGSSISGDISSTYLIVENGSRFNGKSAMVEESKFESTAEVLGQQENPILEESDNP